MKHLRRASALIVALVVLATFAIGCAKKPGDGSAGDGKMPPDSIKAKMQGQMKTMLEKKGPGKGD